MIQRYQTLRIFWMTGFFWICVAWHGDAKPKDHSGELVLLLKKLNHKLEELTNKMSRLEGRIGLLEKQVKKNKEEMEKNSREIKGEMEKKSRDIKEALGTTSESLKAQFVQVSTQKIAMVTEQIQHLTVLFQQSLFKVGVLADALESLQRNVDVLLLGKARSITGLPDGKVRWIPAGEFQMGSGSSDSYKDADEQPQHRVRISRGFWMMETEVTQRQWKVWMGANPAYFKNCGDRCPVDSVRWDEAALFANKLSEREGRESCFVCKGGGDSLRCEGKGNKTTDYVRCKGWRLPTEAEWEYAARAGKTAPRYGKIEKIAWYRGNSVFKTHPVGQKEANAWGLRDLLGNVWEWVYDDYNGIAYQVQSWAAINPVQAATSRNNRILRGGSWYNIAQSVRVALRYNFTSSSRVSNVGFRLLRLGH